MIERLTGVLIEKDPPHIIVDVHGIGYGVLVTMQTMYQLPQCGEPVTLHTQFVVREDAQTLFGFHSQQERALFRALIKVNGVGPKMALSILSGIEPDVFVQCVQEDNVTALTRVPGVGKKTAERLLVEMRDKLNDWTPAVSSIPFSSITDDAVSALVTLGYKAKEAERAVKHVYQADASSESLIRDALKAMVTA